MAVHTGLHEPVHGSMPDMLADQHHTAGCAAQGWSFFTQARQEVCMPACWSGVAHVV